MKTRGILAVAALVVLAGCGPAAAAADPCKEPKATALRLLKAGDPEKTRTGYRVIVNNPHCFGSEALAMAQELLSQSAP